MAAPNDPLCVSRCLGLATGQWKWRSHPLHRPRGVNGRPFDLGYRRSLIDCPFVNFIDEPLIDEIFHFSSNSDFPIFHQFHFSSARLHSVRIALEISLFREIYRGFHCLEGRCHNDPIHILPKCPMIW